MGAADGEPLRLMAVHAHPDDEASKGAASMAMYAAQGVEVLVVTCTGGERGSILNPSFTGRADTPEEMAELRRAEMAAAAQILGVRQHWLGFVDSGLPEGDPPPPLPEGCFALEPVEVAVERLVEVIRDFRPHVMTTYDPTGGYPHPDHIMTHTVSVGAFRAAHDAAAYPDAGRPWQALKLYYNHSFSLTRIRAIHEALVAAGTDSPFGSWIENREVREVPERDVTTRIPCVDYFHARDDALRAHASQVDPDGFFFAVPRDIEAQVWPFEEYELAESLVPTQLPEDDVFAGVREYLEGTHHL